MAKNIAGLLFKFQPLLTSWLVTIFIVFLPRGPAVATTREALSLEQEVTLSEPPPDRPARTLEEAERRLDPLDQQDQRLYGLGLKFGTFLHQEENQNGLQHNTVVGALQRLPISTSFAIVPQIEFQDFKEPTFSILVAYAFWRRVLNLGMSLGTGGVLDPRGGIAGISFSDVFLDTGLYIEDRITEKRKVRIDINYRSSVERKGLSFTFGPIWVW